MMEIIGLLIGIPLGILTSLLAWWILTHKIVPKVSFGKFISKVAIPNSEKYKYRIGIKNSGKRDMLDVDIILELVVKGFDKAVPSNTSYIKLNLNKPKLPKLKKNGRWALSINLNKLPDSLNGYSLEQLLSLKSARLRVLVFGYDGYSGARKVFESKDFKLKDIKEQLFEIKDFE
ncbi:hypothetical protein [Croceivirga thetidis]|uniref:DUF58 domain-containing protein n=1 Tax=Croceivirga thetidis TaxID=2721623 RepID=A0ABX1GTR7_9FLAO|nr:hypothetical protein [Croceivirga thetidis]NKI33354.1 hypothetical protein [Croceivirga thetidis]